MNERWPLTLLICAACTWTACGGGSDDSPAGGSETGGSGETGGTAGASGGGASGSTNSGGNAGAGGMSSMESGGASGNGGAAGTDPMSMDAGQPTDDGSASANDAAFADTAVVADDATVVQDAEPSFDAGDLDVESDLSVAEPPDGGAPPDVSGPLPDAGAPDTAAPIIVCDTGRYVSFQSGVRDLTTGLEWQRWSADGRFTQVTAATYCALDGWRLPTRAELLSIRGTNGTGDTCPVDPCAFHGERCVLFAGARGQGLKDEGQDWGVDMMTGSTVSGSFMAVRCVRKP